MSSKSVRFVFVIALPIVAGILLYGLNANAPIAFLVGDTVGLVSGFLIVAESHT